MNDHVTDVNRNDHDTNININNRSRNINVDHDHAYKVTLCKHKETVTQQISTETDYRTTDYNITKRSTTQQFVQHNNNLKHE